MDIPVYRPVDQLQAGVVFRTFAWTARTRTDTFHLRVDDPPPSESAITVPPEDELVVGEFAVRGAADGPWLLWDAPAPDVASAQEATRFLEGNLHACRERTFLKMDSTDRAVLTEAEFWAPIDALEGRFWEKTIASASATIAERGEEFALRWSHTAATKALALSDRFREAGRFDLDDTPFIGAAIGKGRAAYSEVLRDPDRFDRRWLADQSPSVIWLGGSALNRLVDSDGVLVSTAFSSRQEEFAVSERERVATYQAENGIVVTPGFEFEVARVVVRMAAGYRERLVLARLQGGPNFSRRLTAAVEAAVRHFGGDVAAGPERLNHGVGAFFTGEYFTVKRRSSLNPEEYRARYLAAPAGG